MFDRMFHRFHTIPAFSLESCKTANIILPGLTIKQFGERPYVCKRNGIQLQLHYVGWNTYCSRRPRCQGSWHLRRVCTIVIIHRSNFSFVRRGQVWTTNWHNYNIPYWVLVR